MPDPAREIIKAAKSGNVVRIKELLAMDRGLINALDKDGSTPLHCATWKGQQEVVALLLEFGADVNAQHQRSLGNNTAACGGPRQSGDDCPNVD